MIGLVNELFFSFKLVLSYKVKILIYEKGWNYIDMCFLAAWYIERVGSGRYLHDTLLILLFQYFWGMRSWWVHIFAHAARHWLWIIAIQHPWSKKIKVLPYLYASNIYFKWTTYTEVINIFFMEKVIFLRK